MDLKNILVHLDASKQCAIRFRLAASLARAHGSHLIGLVQMSRRDDGERSNAIVQAFKKHLAPFAPLAFDICQVDDRSPDAAIQCGRASDLVVVAQADCNNAESMGAAYVSEQLALHVDRSILVVPCKTGALHAIGKNLLVAWDGTRKSALALRELSPLLTRASNVSLVSPAGEGRASDGGALLVPRTIAWMEHQGIRVRGAQNLDNTHLAETLSSCAARTDVDLIVLGGYDHTRLREMLLGGVVQKILTLANVPVLLAH